MPRNRSVRVASGDKEPEALPDREWIAYLEGDQDHFLIRHIGEANHLELVLNPQALAEGLEIHIGTKVYRIQYA